MGVPGRILEGCRLHGTDGDNTGLNVNDVLMPMIVVGAFIQQQAMRLSGDDDDDDTDDVDDDDVVGDYDDDVTLSCIPGSIRIYREIGTCNYHTTEVARVKMQLC